MKTRITSVVVLALCVLALSACRTAEQEAAKPAEEPAAGDMAIPGSQKHVLVQGDNLYKIAQQYYGSHDKRYVQLILDANPDINTGRLVVGDVLVIPPKPAEEPVSPELQKALDGMGLENAPTLGPVFRQFAIAAGAKDYDAICDMTCKESQETFAPDLSRHIAVYEHIVEVWGRRVKDPNLSDSSRKQLEDQLSTARESLAELQGFNGDARKYVGYMLMSQFKDMVSGDRIVTGEEIDEDKGVLLFKEKSTNRPITINFRHENGEWKMYLAAPTGTPLEANP